MGGAAGLRAMFELTDVRTRAILCAVLALALILRIVYVLESRANPFFDEPQMDAGYHVEWARAFAHGRDFQPGPFFRAPLYPWFLGLVFRLFGEGLLLPRLIQAVLGTISVALVHAIGARAFDRRTGLLAALMAATYWMLIYFEGELLLPVLEVLFDLLAIWLSLRAGERPSFVRCALAGLAWGVASIVRPNVLLFAPFVAVWIAVRKDPTSLTQGTQVVRAARAAVFGLALSLPILPITAYNRLVGNDSVLISSQAGVNLWIGNNPASDGSSAIVPGTRADWWGGYHDQIRQAEVAEGRSLKPSEVSDWYTKKALGFVRAEPSKALRHLLFKLRLFWMDFELGNNQDERFFAYRFGPLLRFLPLGFGVLAPLSILGLVLSAPGLRRRWPLWGFVPVYTASVVAFFVCSRFRVPVLPVLMVFAAHSLWWCLDAWRSGRRGRVLVALAAALVMAVLVRILPAGLDQSDAKGLWLMGVYEMQHGNPEDAAAWFEDSIDENPRYAIAHQDLGKALVQLSRNAEAEASLHRALSIQPDNVVALEVLFYLLLNTGRNREARDIAATAVARAPLDPTGHYDMGRAILAEADALVQPGTPEGDVQARLEHALREFRVANSLHPEADRAFDCSYAEGTLLARLERPAEAVEAFRRALAARPSPDAAGWYWNAARGLLDALLADQRESEARRAADAWVEQFKDDPRARKLRKQYFDS